MAIALTVQHWRDVEAREAAIIRTSGDAYHPIYSMAPHHARLNEARVAITHFDKTGALPRWAQTT